MSLAVVCHLFSVLQWLFSTSSLEAPSVELKSQATKLQVTQFVALPSALPCLTSTSERSAPDDPHLQTALASDLGEGLAVLARSLGHDLLRHADAVLALQARVGQPVTEVLL